MDNITLFDTFLKDFNKIFENNSNNIISLEQKLINLGDNFTLDLIVTSIESIDLQFKNSFERKEKYYVKDTYTRSLLTAAGYINVKLTRYKDKHTGKSFNYTRDLLNLLPYQRVTLYAEYLIAKYAIENNYSQAARNAIRNTEITRSYVSKLLAKLDGSIHENVPNVKKLIDVLYIEVDEIHANLQNKLKKKGEHPKNSICPTIVVHEGHTNLTKKRKELKNPHYFSSSELSYEELYEIAYDYIDTHYIIDKNSTLFISGDGANGIKTFETAFPNATFILDKFHYKKILKYIFKNSNIVNIADNYLRNNDIDFFKELVYIQTELFPEEKVKMLLNMNFLLKNICAIKNQQHEKYLCPCSMEGTISNKFARYITSSPYAFSKRGLRNKLKLLVLKANKHNLTFDDYILLKYSKDEHKEIIEKINKLVNIEYKLNIKEVSSYICPFTSLPNFNNVSTEEYVKHLLETRNTVRFQ